jgi:membrane protein YqaA with SNARE-associated domain
MIRAGVAQVRNSKSAMEETSDFIKIVQEIVLNPNLGSAIILFFTSFLNELTAILPYAVVLAGQLVFLEGEFSTAFLAKLLVFVAVPVGVGSALGVIPVYALSYFVEKFQKYLRFSWHDVEKVSRRFTGEWYDDVIFLLLRSIPILPSLPLSIAAGFLRMRFAPYLVLSLAGFIIRMMLSLMVVGFGVHGLSRIVVFFYTN